MGYIIIGNTGGGGGSGDMTKAVYDANSDSIVDNANAVEIAGLDIDPAVAGAIDDDILIFNAADGEWELENAGTNFQRKKTYPGNPNTFVDARIGDECLDTTTKINYVKTTPLGTLTGWVVE